MGHLPACRAILERAAAVMYAEPRSRAELIRLIPSADALVPALNQRIDRRVLDAAPRLTVIATPSTGTDHIDLAAARSRGIEVQSLKDDPDLLRTITSTAEHAFLLMLACLRRLPFAFDDVKRGRWRAADWRGREAAGRTVGIVGYGRLGAIFSRLALGFGMKVIACDPFKKITDPWVEPAPMGALLKRAEIVTLHVHLTPETRGLIGVRELARLRPGAVLINTARGALVDERALLRALESGRLAAAGLDVLARELEGRAARDPLVRYARTHANLILTPHVGGCTVDAQEKAFRRMAEKLAARLRQPG